MFTVDEILAVTRGELISGDRSCVATGVSIDSRTIQEGDLFVPLLGDRFNGHDYLGEVLQHGAAGALIQGDRAIETFGPFPGNPRQGAVHKPFCIRVGDPLKALQSLAAVYRRRFAIPAVGITGSNGKSTTKEMTGSILRERFPILMTSGNLNNHIGVPLTLLGLKPEHQAAVLEMGISAPRELTLLCEMADPSVAVITNIGPAHIEGFHDVTSVAEAKAEILDYMDDGGQAVLNADDPFFEMLSKRTRGRIVSFGRHESADVRALEVHEVLGPGISPGLSLTVAIASGPYEIFLPVIGAHNAYNALASLAVGCLWGLSIDELQAGLKKFVPLPQRMTLQQIGGLAILNDVYNANPSSMTAALEVLARHQQGRHGLAILGDMLELGDLSAQAHYDIGKKAGELGIGGVVSVGAFGSHTVQGAIDGGIPADRVRHCEDHEQVVSAIFALRTGPTLLLIKGSRGMRMERVIEGLERRQSQDQHPERKS